jgi:hypothetical protein
MSWTGLQVAARAKISSKRWRAKRTWRFLQGESPCWVRANHSLIPSIATVRKVVQEVE